MQPIDFCALVLAVAAIIGCANHLWIRLPRSIGVLAGSLLLALLVFAADRLSGLPLVAWCHRTMDAADLPHLFLDGTLALLLFAGSLHVDARELNRGKWIILILATGSVILSATIFGVGVWAAFRIAGAAVPLAWCCVIGAILAPTDAVVVESFLRRAPLPARLRGMITGESLFNDGAALVLYLAVLGITQGRTHVIGHGRLLEALVLAVAGGAVIGGLCGGAAALLIGRVRDEGLQLMISLALVIGCYRLAEAAEVSAPIAVVTAGLCIKLLTPELAPGSTRYATLLGFWGMLDELLDTILFLLIGFQVLALTFDDLLLPAIMAVPLALAARMLSVAVPAGLSPEPFRDRLRDVAVLTWTGLRGGVSVALALTLPPSPYRAQLLGVCYAVVVFSIVVQGLTMTRVLQALYGRAP